MNTSQISNPDIKPRAGCWILLVGPRSMKATLLTVIARLGERGAVRVLDGGNRFKAYAVARAAHGRLEILDRITISRAFTCYQVHCLLESTPALPTPFGLLDLLNSFYGESVQARERKRLLRSCLPNLERLVRTAGGMVSVQPPAVLSATAQELREMLQDSASDAYSSNRWLPSPSR